MFFINIQLFVTVEADSSLLFARFTPGIDPLYLLGWPSMWHLACPITILILMSNVVVFAPLVIEMITPLHDPGW
jgi:hypothetical protein